MANKVECLSLYFCLFSLLLCTLLHSVETLLFLYIFFAKMNVLICSYNVRGLGNHSKREQIFSWIKEKNIDVCLLHETHSSEETNNVWKQQWDSCAFFSGEKSNSEGTGILINSKFSCDVINYTDIITGRLQALDIKVNNKEITIINIYGPNKGDSAVFDKLENYIINQRTNGPVNAHLISGPTVSTKKKQILTSIKGRNSVANLRNTIIYDTNIDLVNDDVYTKFGLIL